ncbi:MAG: hypothetical protein R3E96_11775 [Planctomycetota bacterium]
MARLRFPLLLSLTFLLLLARAGAQGEQPASLPPNQSTAELEAALGALTGEDPEVVKQRGLTATLENLAAEATLRSNIQSKRREIEEVPGRKANLSSRRVRRSRTRSCLTRPPARSNNSKPRCCRPKRKPRRLWTR